MMGMAGDDEESGPLASDGPVDPFELEAKTFLDTSLPMPERSAALKEAIRLCLEEDKSGGYGTPGGGEKGGKGDAGLALIFGPSKKKS